jgi:hypothetical protein
MGGVVMAPILKPTLRPIAREADGAIVFTRYIHRLALEVPAEVEDLAEEATAELDSKRVSHEKCMCDMRLPVCITSARSDSFPLFAGALSSLDRSNLERSATSAA